MKQQAISADKVVLVCSKCNSKKVLRAMRDELKERGARKRVRVQKTGCLGECGGDTNILVCPDNVMFTHVAPKDVPELLDTVCKSA